MKSAILAVATSVVSTAYATVPATIFAPAPMLNKDRHDPAEVQPSTTASLHYASNLTNNQDSNINITHTMKYPTVILENVASVVSVDCDAVSVAVTFNDSSIFETTQTAWDTVGDFVLITNHLGDCDVELERGYFLVQSLSFDNTTLVATASSEKSNVSSVAAVTEVTFGSLSGSALAGRDLVIDPSYTLNTAIALPADTVLYTYSPYLTVTADAASFVANVTFSGYLSYNWLTFTVTDLYFDIDSAFTAAFEISADVTSAYNTTFTYAPATLSYSLVSVPGILELGPELSFSVSADIAASEAVDLTATASISLADGNVHVDLLNEDLTTTSDWSPDYSVGGTVSGVAVASINPYAGLTVEIGINFFAGLIDLSSGLTASPGFTNVFTLTGGESIDLSGLTNLTSEGTCGNGLALQSDFTFNVLAFVTEWWSDTIYTVDVPIVNECYPWVS